MRVGFPAPPCAGKHSKLADCSAVNTSKAPAARLYAVAGGSTATTSKPPAARGAHARCAPRSLALLAPCGVAGGFAAGCPWRVAPRCLRRLRAPRDCPFESRPDRTAPHASPASSAGLRFAPAGRLPRGRVAPERRDPARRRVHLSATVGVAQIASRYASSVRSTSSSVCA